MGTAHDTRTKLVIVGDHEVVAPGIRALLSRQDDIEVLGSAGSAAEQTPGPHQVGAVVNALRARLISTDE